MKKTALIVAGGSGIRFNNNTPKQFLLIDNKPVLMYTIERVCQLDNIYVVLPKSHFDHWHNWMANHVTLPGWEGMDHKSTCCHNRYTLSGSG